MKLILNTYYIQNISLIFFNKFGQKKRKKKFKIVNIILVMIYIIWLLILFIFTLFFISGIVSIPIMTYYMAADTIWGLGYAMCQFWLCLDYMMCNASVLNLLLISFDRYFSVTRPLTYRPRFFSLFIHFHIFMQIALTYINYEKIKIYPIKNLLKFKFIKFIPSIYFRHISILFSK